MCREWLGLACWFAPNTPRPGTIIQMLKQMLSTKKQRILVWPISNISIHVVSYEHIKLSLETNLMTTAFINLHILCK